MSNKTVTKRNVFSWSKKHYPCSGQLQITEGNAFWLDTRKRVGSDLPRYRSIIKAGLGATNAFDATDQSIILTSGFIGGIETSPSCPNKGKESSTTHLGYLPSLYPVLTTGSAKQKEAESLALVKVRQRIGAQTQSYQGLTVLAELRETLHSLKHPADALRQNLGVFSKGQITLRDKRRRKQISKKDYADAVAGTWLEFSFGIKPLINDITSIAESALPTYTEKRIIRLSGKGETQDATEATQILLPATTKFVLPTKVETKLTYQSRYVVGYREEIAGPSTGLQRIIDMGGFHLDQIIPTVWEMLPWSFFIDYFSNIGDVINSSLVNTKNVAWTMRQTRLSAVETRVTQEPVKNPSAAYPDILSGYSPMTVTRKSSRYIRTSGTLDFPTICFTLPSRRTQFFNIAALATLLN